MMKKIFFVAVLVFVLALPVMAEGDVIAVIQGQEVSRDELDNSSNLSQLIMQIYQMDQQFAQLLFSTESGQKLLDEYRKIQLEEYIMQILLNKEVENRGITLTQDEKFKIFKDQLDSVMAQNNFTQEQLLSILQQQGFESIEEYQNFFLEQNGDLMAIGVLRDQIIEGVAVEESEVQEYYLSNQKYFKTTPQVHARHILLETKEKAEEVLAKIKEGADFAEMAKEYSTGPTGPDGGDLGFFSQGDMVPEFDQAVFALKVGEVSAVVQTQFGYHIIKVEEMKPESLITFEDAKEQIRQGLLEQKKEELWNKFLEDLRSNADVEVLL